MLDEQAGDALAVEVDEVEAAATDRAGEVLGGGFSRKWTVVSRVDRCEGRRSRALAAIYERFVR